MIELMQAMGCAAAAVLLVIVADRERSPVISRLRVAMALCLIGLGMASAAHHIGGPTLMPETRETVLTVLVWLVAGASAVRLIRGERHAPPRRWR